MKNAVRYVVALLAVLCLVGAAMLGMFGLVTTEAFAAWVTGEEELQRMQQRIDGTVAALQETWKLDAELLSPWSDQAAEQQAAIMAAWWGELWQNPEADYAMPAWLDAQEEAILVADVRRDDGFISMTDENMRRAIARDEIAYTLDEAVCDAVTPLRRSILELGLTLLADWKPLPSIRQASVDVAAVLACAGVALLVLAHRAAGSALASAGLSMLVLSVPVWLLNLPGMLAQLNAVAVLQCVSALKCMGLIWYGAAALMMAAGACIIAGKRLRGGRKSDPAGTEGAECPLREEAGQPHHSTV